MLDATPALLAVLVGLAVAQAWFIGRPLRWFSLHPALMLLAFLAAASAGIAAKRKGGRQNTLDHAWLMCGAALLSLGGWYVIYEQKEMHGKPHNTSWHAWTGLGVIGFYAAGALGGLTALHPDTGIAKTEPRFRWAHKLMGRFATALAFATLVSGWYKLGGAASTACLTALLLTLAGAVLTPVDWRPSDTV